MDDRRLCEELHSRGHVALARLVALRLLPTAPFEDEGNTSVASAEDSVDLSTDTSSSVDEDIPETFLANTESDVEEPPAPAWVAHFDREVLRYLLSDALLP
ncbi:hypothetical protein CYMTET_3754 [Cymbomonas tetramitiformis]|uniref:Uncharacterized protein n=1 Tax=Cymbomonas tetramitiformis TaxID=36881 RepID=A0AAE0LKR2_9CHLO|nr:hypothetical protein CYMTET_3754 [Cymbomonas tetramitiformis]|eukprot:gene24249-29449_t